MENKTISLLEEREKDFKESAGILLLWRSVVFRTLQDLKGINVSENIYRQECNKKYAYDFFTRDSGFKYILELSVPFLKEEIRDIQNAIAQYEHERRNRRQKDLFSNPAKTYKININNNYNIW